ncbi:MULTISPECIES: oligosaccharide flippase family protein [unclassified Undibacterium]|uniref:oligosaccharide flippase family protein n=1 Tax=unclassified Undibacterium TaxID=2630295 RepID=UPI002AC8B7D3|nr:MULTISPECIES: oligosaccharide flippase family protein [unclassified Undibacterium]MEB0140988.1 oligosaccharide flippase family protein [Undibacterium sp. CCC2.1]MEB0174006.1 oligosaccharide flippase family protein [Undibacterium sp. CCC1.1]MEB0177928.1 oligosaccharide flippase family protein [Undibacterium sp. CCC3.4]MEB0217188.1 oligosaccharide flippase family protein [Undibacterium sp. 5I2]WPX42164.1 oligosaccharide flippase family protein [Undibacterium sp. CCC3.4]
MSAVTKNILYLVLVQAIIYLAPLTTLPYLTRTLDIAAFAALGFAQALIQYFILVTDYGFGITATRLIAISDGKKSSVSAIVANTIAVKLLLALCSALLCLALVGTFAPIRENAALLAMCFIGVIGNALFPTWLFQGLEKMRVLALITSTSRLLPLPLVFVFVNSHDDVLLAALLQNISGLLAALFSFAYLLQTRMLVSASISRHSIVSMLKEGWPVFLSNISTSFYTTLNLILLKFFGLPEQVAFFAATDRIRVAAQGFIQPVAAALFPRVAALSQQPGSAAECSILLRRGAWFMMGIQLCGGAVMFFGADYIALHYLGEAFAPASWYLKALAFLPSIIAVAAMLSQWRFLALGQSRSMSKIYLCAGPLHALYGGWLTYHYQSGGLIASLYFTEMMITLTMVLLLKQKKISLW